MHVSRTGFIKLTGTGLACRLLDLGFDLKPVKAYASALKIEGAKEVALHLRILLAAATSLCPLRTAVWSAPRRSGLSGERRIALLQGFDIPVHALQRHPLQKPLYRAPESDRWEEKDWDFVWTASPGESRTLVTRISFSRTTRASRSTGWKASSNSAPPRWTTRSALVAPNAPGARVVHMDHQAASDIAPR